MKLKRAKQPQFKQNKMNKLATLIIASLTSGALISCSGGSSTINSTPDYPNGESTVNVYKAVAGPVSYQQIDVWFQESGHAIYPDKKSNLATLSRSCGNVMNNTGTGLAIVSALVSFIPVVGPGLTAATAVGGALATADGAAHASSCQAMEFQQVQQSLSSQELQITMLQHALQVTDNQIWNAITDNSYANLTTSFSLYKDAIQSVDNSVQSIMTKSNLWNQNTFKPIAYTSMKDYVSQNRGKGFQTATNQFINGTTGQLALAINRLAGVNTLNEDSVTGEILPTIYFDPTSTLVTLYRSMYNATMDKITTQLQNTNNDNSNVVQLINDYNNAIIAIYLQSVNAIQSSYALGFEINQANYEIYNNYANLSPDTNNYFGRLLNTPGTYYNPVTSGYSYESAGGQTQAYNRAQHNLTIYNASLINMLFQTTMGFIITDNTQGNQSFPDTEQFNITNPYIESSFSGESVNYTKLIGSLLPKGSYKTPRELIYNAYVSAIANTGQQLELSLLAAESANNNVGANFTFYQFPLMNVAQLSNSLESYNAANTGNTLTLDAFLKANESTLPTIYATSTNNNPSVESSVATANTLQPYSLNTTAGYPTLMGSVTNNLQACNGYPVGNIPGYSLYTYMPNGTAATLGIIGKQYLMCGNWSTAGFPNATNTTGQVGQQLLTNESYVATYMTSFQSTSDYTYSTNYIINNLSPQYKYYPAADHQTQSSYPSSGAPFTVMNGSNMYWNYTNLGESLTYITAQNMGSNYPSISNGQAVSYVLAIQTTLADGFIASFGLTNSNIKGAFGNFSGISVNPNLSSVYIEKSPILNQAGTPPKATNQWGPAPNATYGLLQNINLGTQTTGSNYAPATGYNYLSVYPTSFILNGNTFIVTGSTTNVGSYIFIGGNAQASIESVGLWENTYTAPTLNGVTCYYPSSLYSSSNDYAYVNLGYTAITMSNGYIWSLWCELTPPSN